MYSWVSNGVVGSQAFAAFDQGYDVFFGNLRGLASREHVNKHISSQSYWHFSVNEHGTQDIPALLTKVHELKTMELAKVRDDENESSDSLKLKEHGLPYTMCGVAHSLGGAALLIYIVTRRLDNKPHYLSRLILLSPAGFHEDAPIALKLVRFILPILAPVLSPFVPGIYIPTRLFRGLFNKLSRDFQNYPALGGLVQALLSYVVGGDNSNWVGAIGVSHYNMNDMPGVSFRVAIHLAQMMRTRRFIMFDYGSVSANMQAYGTPYPLDIGLHYDLIDIPVFIVAGLKDRVIPPSMVRKHYEMMRNAGCQVSYAEFEYAHLDFTFANREELMAYVLSQMSVSLPRQPGNSRAPLVEDQHPTNKSASMKNLNFTNSRQPINKSD
jgi:pimeloyl-ACP methyl ester carboxylesterase